MIMDTTEDKDTHWVPWVAVALIAPQIPLPRVSRAPIELLWFYGYLCDLRVHVCPASER